MSPFVIDLFSGTGSASEPMVRAGWRVLRVDLEPLTKDGVAADCRTWQFVERERERVDLLWCSPPCTEFARESMPWSRTGRAPDMSCVEAVHRLVAEIQPRYWVLENVKGAVPYLGKPQRRIGPTFLWGHFPFFLASPIFWKEKLSSKDRMKRSIIPSQISNGLRLAIEAEIAEEQAT